MKGTNDKGKSCTRREKECTVPQGKRNDSLERERASEEGRKRRDRSLRSINRLTAKINALSGPRDNLIWGRAPQAPHGARHITH